MNLKKTSETTGRLRNYLALGLGAGVLGSSDANATAVLLHPTGNSNTGFDVDGDGDPDFRDSNYPNPFGYGGLNCVDAFSLVFIQDLGWGGRLAFNQNATIFDSFGPYTVAYSFYTGFNVNGAQLTDGTDVNWMKFITRDSRTNKDVVGWVDWEFSGLGNSFTVNRAFLIDSSISYLQSLDDDSTIEKVEGLYAQAAGINTVPDTGSTLGLLTLGFAGVERLRRKLRAA